MAVALSLVEIENSFNPSSKSQGGKEEIKMAFYIHLGCELSGTAGSNRVVDRWIHALPLFQRLEIMATVLAL